MLKNVTPRCHTLIEAKGLVLDLLGTSLEHILKSLYTRFWIYTKCTLVINPPRGGVNFLPFLWIAK